MAKSLYGKWDAATGSFCYDDKENGRCGYTKRIFPCIL